MKALVFDISSEGLEPLQHRIVGITIKTELEEKIFTDREETKVLVDFWKYLNDNNFEMIIGFNSEGFDVPFLLVRSVKYGLKMANVKDKFMDLRKMIFGDEHRKGKLQDFQNLLGIEKLKSGFAKSHMSLLWDEKARHIENLNDLLLQDVRITWELYLKMKEVGMIG